MKLFILLITISVTLAAVIKHSDGNHDEVNHPIVVLELKEVGSVETEAEDSGTMNKKREKRGFWDGIPIVSQFISLVQVASGDAEGAKRTQENFSKQFPVISQIRSAVEAIAGDEEAAKQTQMHFVKTVSDVADGVPIIGHTKGLIHLHLGDFEGGEKAIAEASRGFVVALASVGGGILAGPVGAAVASIATGTTVDAAVHIKKENPMGIFKSIDDMKDGVTAKKVMETILSPVGDVLPGPGDLISSVPNFL